MIEQNDYSPAGIYLFKVNNGNTRTMYEIRWKLAIKTSQRRGTSGTEGEAGDGFTMLFI